MPVTEILIVDDDSSVAQELSSILERLGYMVVGISASGRDALSAIEKIHPALILMNIRLKGAIDGIKTGSLIRAHRDIPIVYVIGSGNQTTIRRAGATEPFGYIFMPFDEKRIFATVETARIRHEFESKLHQSRQWLNTTLTSIGDGVIATDEHGQIRFVNPSAMRQTGWHHSEAIGRSLAEVFSLYDEHSHEAVDLLNSAGRSTPAKPEKMSFTGELLTKDKRQFPVEATISFIEDGKGTIFGRVLVFREITHQREMLQEVERRARQAEALVQVASHLNAHLDLEGVLRSICEITNRTIQAAGTVVLLPGNQKERFQNKASVSDDPALKAYQGTKFDIPLSLLENILSSAAPVIVIGDIQEHTELPFLEVYRKMDIRTVALAALLRGDCLVGVLIAAFTRQPKTLLEDEYVLLRGLADQASSAIEHAELFEQVRAGRERQRKLAKSLVDIQETERRRIARELHDHLGQSLTGLQFMLETAKNQAEGSQRTSLEQVQETVSDIIRDVREMSLNLRPSMLDDMGLVPTLLWHFDRFTSQTGIHVNFQYDEFPERLPLEIETAAYRIVQEALTNAARYAQVHEVFVGLVSQRDTLWVEVLDNGKGFDLAAETERPSSGLSGMRERANLLGGYVLVESFLGQGTQIVAALPLTNRPLERRKHERNHPAG